jgi:signal transduction histidine kinase
MRSPLTSILFLSEILHRGQSGDFNEVQKRQIGIIYSAALGLVGLASDMIEMAKGGSRLRDPAPEAFSVNEILRSVHDLVQPTAEEKKLSVTIHTLESEHRIGFPIPLNRILLNLTTNALKFTHSGGVDVTAEQVHSTRVRFSVRDTGPGIAPEAIETLYQPFRREPSRESGYYFSGTGLGLAICRRLVKALGAEIHIETRPEWGTRFYFELDLPPASAVMM